VLSLAAAIPFLAALGNRVIGSSSQPDATVNDYPALVFDQYMVPRGEVPPSQFVFAHFKFRNKGSKTVRVTELIPSCGCLNPQLDKRVYKPGEVGEFLIRVRAANEEPGPKEYSMQMHYTDPQPRVAELKLKVTLPSEKVVIRPKALIFYQLKQAATTHDVVVTDYRGETFAITGIESSSPFVTVKLASTDTDADGNRRLRIAVTVSDNVPPGRTRAVIRLKTDDPIYSELTVPLLIEGPRATIDTVNNGFTITPKSVVFSRNEPLPAVRELTISAAQAGLPELIEPHASSPHFSATFVADGTSAKPNQRRLRITLHKLPPLGRYRSILTVNTTAQNRPPLQVPLIVRESSGTIRQVGATDDDK
jgi:hypothetical protein